MQPWQAKMKELVIKLPCCARADAMAWLEHRGHRGDFQPASAPEASAPTPSLTPPLSVSTPPLTPPPSQVLPGNNNALVPIAVIPAAPAGPIRRRQSVSGGALFSVNDEVVEMGTDYLRHILTVFNRFDPFQRLPKGPMRMRSRSVDLDRQLATICEINEVEENHN